METFIERLEKCVSCGCRLGSQVDVGKFPFEVQDAMQVRCETCAKEVLGIAIPFVGTLQHDAGGGRRVIRDSKTLA